MDNQHIDREKALSIIEEVRKSLIDLREKQAAVERASKNAMTQRIDSLKL